MFCMFYIAENHSTVEAPDDSLCTLHAMQMESRTDLMEYLERSRRGEFILNSICPIKSNYRCPYLHGSQPGIDIDPKPARPHLGTRDQ